MSVTRTMTGVAIGLALCWLPPAGAQSLTNFDQVVYVGLYTSVLGSATDIFDGGSGTYDDQVSTISLPFPFTFDGTVYTDVDVCVNGYVTFGVGGSFGTITNVGIPDPSPPNPILAAWWDDLLVTNFGATDHVLYDTIGAPGQRRFIIEWNSVSHFGDSATDYSFLNFQIHLIEGNNQIEFRYGTNSFVGSPGDFTATVGAENHAGTGGFQTYAGAPNLTRANFPASGTVVLFRPPLPPWSYSVTSASAPAPVPGSPTTLWDGGVAEQDDAAETIRIGFPFVYDGVNYLDLHVCVNGFGKFGGIAYDYFNVALPNQAAPNALLAPWWDDLYVRAYGTTDLVRYERAGSVGNRTLMVEWHSISRISDTASDYHFLYFQLWLREANNSITFWYDWSGSTGSPPQDFSATTGIEGTHGVYGIDALGNSPNQVFTDFPQSVRYDFVSVACGDCNQDGVVTITDALAGAQHAVALITLPAAGFRACNVTGTPGGPAIPGAVVGVVDALLIAQFTAGLPVLLTC